MKDNYRELEMETVCFAAEDVIVTSPTGEDETEITGG